MKRSIPRGRRYDQALSIEELRVIARRRLPNFIYEYIHGGSDDEISLANNRSVFNRYYFTPKTLTNVKARDLRCKLFGKEVNMPVAIGPTGFNGMVTKDGDMKLAQAAARQGIPFTLSNVSTVPLEDIAKVSNGWHWMQIYFYRDRQYVENLVKRCHESGYDTIIVTTDSAIYGNREWDARNFSRPLVLNWRNKLDVALKPHWALDVLYPDGIPKFKNIGDLLPEDASVQGAASEIGKHLNPGLDWEEIKWLRSIWDGNLVLKGILSVEESKIAVECGVDGVVLSNHGGRQLDYSVSPMEILKEVREAVGDKLTILVDSGFRRGSDIIKAIMLGADGVLLARTTLYGLGAGGEAGVIHALNIIHREIDRTLGLLGCSTLAELDASLMVEAKA